MGVLILGTGIDMKKKIQFYLQELPRISRSLKKYESNSGDSLFAGLFLRIHEIPVSLYPRIPFVVNILLAIYDIQRTQFF